MRAHTYEYLINIRELEREREKGKKVELISIIIHNLNFTTLKKPFRNP